MGETRNYILLSLLLIVTILYCCFIYLGMGFYKILLESQGIKNVSSFTVVTSTSPLLWQILAFISLAASSLFAFFSSRKQESSQPFFAAATFHINWLLICFLMHGLGFLVPFVMWVYVLK